MDNYKTLLIGFTLSFAMLMASLAQGSMNDPITQFNKLMPTGNSSTNNLAAISGNMNETGASGLVSGTGGNSLQRSDTLFGTILSFFDAAFQVARVFWLVFLIVMACIVSSIPITAMAFGEKVLIVQFMLFMMAFVAAMSNVMTILAAVNIIRRGNN